MLGMAFTAHLRSIIYRREFKQLAGIVDRAVKILTPLGGRDLFNQQQMRFTLPDGRKLELGGMQREDDWEKYQGIPHDMKAYDEAPQFSRLMVEMLNIWSRTDDPEQRVRTVLAGNPPTSVEGEWIIDMFAPWLDMNHSNPAKPGELRHFATLDGLEVELPNGELVYDRGEWLKPRSRTFIPARVTDNPVYVKSGYDQILQGLPPELRARFRDGQFIRSTNDQEYQVIPTAWVTAAMDRWKAHEAKHGKNPPAPLDAVGVDVAAGGADETVFAAKHGNWIAPLTVFKGIETPDGRATAQKVYEAGLLKPDAPVTVDLIGVGTDAYGRIKDIHTDTHAFVASEGSKGHAKESKQLTFRNLRAEAWWRLREMLDPEKGTGLMLPPDETLRRDLCAPKWRLSTGGVQVESKEDIKKRLKRSTNHADAVILACFEGKQKQGFRMSVF